MFESNFNIVSGDRDSGRSSFLFTLAYTSKSNGYKTMFLGGTDEFSSISDIESPFDRKFFYRHRDQKLTENIKLILDKEKFDYLLIDDIDFLSRNDIVILGQSKAKKICTCLRSKIPTNLGKFTSYDLTSKYDDDNLTESSFLNVDGQLMKLNDFIKILDREQKINKVLK